MNAKVKRKKNLNFQHCMCLWWAIGNIGNMICVKNSKLHIMKMWMSTAAAQKFNAYELFTFEFNWKCHHCGLSWMNYVSNFVYKRLFNVRGPSIHSFGISNESFKFRFRTTSRMVKQWCMRESSSRTWSHNGQEISIFLCILVRSSASVLSTLFAFLIRFASYPAWQWEKYIFPGSDVR